METRTQQPFLIPNALPFIQPTERIGKQRVGGAYVVAWWKAQATTRLSDLETHFFSTIPRTVTPPLCSETSAPRLLLTNHERDRWKRNYRVSRRFIARVKKKKIRVNPNFSFLIQLFLMQNSLSIYIRR